ncbi:MAG: hypothetical protein ACD_75C00862G0004, partial [uncultured bacterium]
MYCAGRLVVRIVVLPCKTMVQKTDSQNSVKLCRLGAKMEHAANPVNTGVVVSVRGSVVDVRFDVRLPPIANLLRAGTNGAVVIEVLAHLDRHRVRGIALTPTQGVARGMA